MAIKINLPVPSDYDTGIYEQAKSFLHQLELAVHHAQKSIDEMHKLGLITDDSYIIYRFPGMKLEARQQNEKGEVLVHIDEETGPMQEIQLEIHQ